jgi:hypothetical protein
MEKYRVGTYGSYYDCSTNKIAISGLGTTLTYPMLDLIYNQTQNIIYFLPVTGKANVNYIYQDPCTFKNVIDVCTAAFSPWIDINPCDNIVLQLELEETDLDRNLGARIVSTITNYDPDAEELVNTTNVAQSSGLQKEYLRLRAGGTGYPIGLNVSCYVDQDISTNVIYCDVSTGGIILNITRVISSSSGFYPATNVPIRCISTAGGNVGSGAYVDILDVSTVNYYPDYTGLDIMDCQGFSLQISSSDGVWTTIEATDEVADAPTRWFNITKLGTVTGAPFWNYDSDAMVGKNGYTYFKDAEIFLDFDDINRQKLRVKMPTVDASNTCYVSIKRKLKTNP